MLVFVQLEKTNADLRQHMGPEAGMASWLADAYFWDELSTSFRSNQLFYSSLSTLYKYNQHAFHWFVNWYSTDKRLNRTKWPATITKGSVCRMRKSVFASRVYFCLFSGLKLLYQHPKTAAAVQPCGSVFLFRDYCHPGVRSGADGPPGARWARPVVRLGCGDLDLVPCCVTWRHDHLFRLPLLQPICRHQTVERRRRGRVLNFDLVCHGFRVWSQSAPVLLFGQWPHLQLWPQGWLQSISSWPLPGRQLARANRHHSHFLSLR